ncbi:MAG: alpha/beta hydrolase [Acidimicrobiia bacterium]
MPLDPVAREIAEATSAIVRWGAIPADELRDTMRLLAAPATIVTVAEVDDRYIDGPGGSLPIRIYRPSQARGLPVAIYLHGGGWVFGDLDSADHACRRLCADAGVIVVSVGYRLAPEHRFPAALDDCLAAIDWVRSAGPSLGFDGSSIALVGDSAGANLATAATLRCRDLGGEPVRLQVLIYPVTGTPWDDHASYIENRGLFPNDAAMEFFIDCYIADDDDLTNPYCVPDRATDLSGLPQALVVTAEGDPLRDEGEAYGHRLIEAGVRCEVTRYGGMIHGFYVMDAALAPARDAQRKVAGLVRRVLMS